MRIVLITAAFPLSKDSNKFHSPDYQVATSLKAEGHELLIASFEYEDALSEMQKKTQDGMDVVRVGINSHNHVLFQQLIGRTTAGAAFTNALHLYLSCNKEIEEFCPDLIEVQGIDALGYFWALEGRHPLVVRCHKPLSDGFSNSVDSLEIHTTSALEYATLAMVDGVIASKPSIVEKLMLDANVPGEKVAYIKMPPPVSIKERHAKLENKNSMFPRLFYWAKDSPRAELDALITSLPLIARIYPNFSLTLAGIKQSMFDSADSIMPTLQSRLVSLRLDEQVDVIPHQPNQPAPIQVCVTSDITIFPGASEFKGMSAIGAASAGACIIYLDLDDSNWLESEIDCLVVRPLDPHALARAVIRLAGDKALRSSISNKAHERISNSVQTFVERSIDFYKLCIERRLTKSGYIDCSKTSKYVLSCMRAALTGNSLELDFKARRRRKLGFGIVSTLEEAYELGFAKGKGERIDPRSVLRVLRKGLVHKVKRK
jgi:glycosyltransferase involved in cell wall biosynthesis